MNARWGEGRGGVWCREEVLTRHTQEGVSRKKVASLRHTGGGRTRCSLSGHSPPAALYVESVGRLGVVTLVSNGQAQ